GDVDEPAEQDALQGKVAEKDKCVVVGSDGPVEPALPPVAVLGQQRVEGADDAVVDGAYAAGRHRFVLGPGAVAEKALVGGPVLGQPVPGDAVLVREVGLADPAGELPQPVQGDGGPPRFLQGGPGGVLGPAQGRNVILPDVQRGDAPGEELGLPPACVGQGSVGVVGDRQSDVEGR